MMFAADENTHAGKWLVIDEPWEVKFIDNPQHFLNNEEWYDGAGWYAVGQLKGGTAFIGGYSTSECAYMAAIYAKFYELRGVQPTPHDEHHIAVHHTSRMQ